MPSPDRDGTNPGAAPTSTAVPSRVVRRVVGSAVVGSAVEAVLPGRLGVDLRWLVASSWTTNLADGIAIAAGPLLVESLTDDPLVVGLSWMLGRLPWLLVGLQAGVAADRFDRRRLLIGANLARVVVVAVLATLLLADAARIEHVLVAIFLIGLAETLVDTTSTTLVPMLVAPRDLALANTRFTFGLMGLNQLVGPALGAVLFVVGASVPFVTQGVAIAFGVLLVSRVRLPDRAEAVDRSSGGVRREIVAGLSWLWGDAAVRTLAITILVFNLTFGAAWSVLVVLATERLGLGEIGFGLLTTISAVGGVVGTVLYGRTEARFGMATIMRVGLVVETLTHLVLATVTVAWPALVALFCFGVHASMWGITSSTVRQARVPERMQGRVASVYLVGLQAGLVVGAVLGGVLAQIAGIAAPYWFGFVGSALMLAAIWRTLGQLALVPASSTE